MWLRQSTRVATASHHHISLTRTMERRTSSYRCLDNKKTPALSPVVFGPRAEDVQWYRHGLGHRRSLVIIEARGKLVTQSHVEGDYHGACHPSCVAGSRKEASERAASNVLPLPSRYDRRTFSSKGFWCMLNLVWLPLSLC